MKKVGIVTFFKANNFGVCLQALATYRFIQNNGYDAEIIRYECPYEHRTQKWMYKENNKVSGYFTSFAKNLLLGKMHYFKKGFGHVTEHYELSDKCYTSFEQMQDLDYDILVSGSDQIWSSSITGVLDQAFLLNFGNNPKRISIASSLGSKEIPCEERDIFQKCLSQYSAVSVREQFAKDQLQPLIEQEIKVLMDPTFFFNRQEWIELLGRKSKYFEKKEKYILCYFIAGNKFEYAPRVRAYAEKLGLPVWTIQFSNYKWKVSDKAILGATIEDFIALFANADLILTDSFHGTAFSLNMERNFVPFKHSGNPLRIINLLERLELRSRLDMAASDYEDVDYTAVKPALESLREDSKQWTLKALDNE